MNYETFLIFQIEIYKKTHTQTHESLGKWADSIENCDTE